MRDIRCLVLTGPSDFTKTKCRNSRVDFGSHNEDPSPTVLGPAIRLKGLAKLQHRDMRVQKSAHFPRSTGARTSVWDCKIDLTVPATDQCSPILAVSCTYVLNRDRPTRDLIGTCSHGVVAVRGRCDFPASERAGVSGNRDGWPADGTRMT
jgi:hypothetical protein